MDLCAIFQSCATHAVFNVNALKTHRQRTVWSAASYTQYTVCTHASCTLAQLDVLVLERPVAEDEASWTEPWLCSQEDRRSSQILMKLNIELRIAIIYGLYKSRERKLKTTQIDNRSIDNRWLYSWVGQLHCQSATKQPHWVTESTVRTSSHSEPCNGFASPPINRKLFGWFFCVYCSDINSEEWS